MTILVVVLSSSGQVHSKTKQRLGPGSINVQNKYENYLFRIETKPIDRFEHFKEFRILTVLAAGLPGGAGAGVGGHVAGLRVTGLASPGSGGG